ncbi:MULTISPECIES: hypothetical protein [Streptomyces]|uniref:hypothetical protein n=1 Tax=Streptomyces TaxID=1883 RepID=UPI000B1EFB75|nr:MULTISPECIES: hypothetical protein [unclassified Streptomyces]
MTAADSRGAFVRMPGLVCQRPKARHHDERNRYGHRGAAAARELGTSNPRGLFLRVLEATRRHV